MDKGVQKNAASAQESASASEVLKSQAERMQGYVAELTAIMEGKGNGNRRRGANPQGGRQTDFDQP